MPTRLSQDERKAVARRIFAALCAHYSKHYIALIEPEAAANSPEQVLSAARAAVQASDMKPMPSHFVATGRTPGTSAELVTRGVKDPIG